jgi:hypothetical protein
MTPRMTQRMRWHFAVLALSVGGCGRQPAAPVPAPVPVQAPIFDSIRLDRSACFGNCPVYHIEIHKDGKATFTGEEHVKAQGVREMQLRQDDVALLATVVQRMGFWTLKSSYQDEKDGCATTFTDQASLSIQVVSSGKTKAVTLYQGCLGAAIPSDALGWLADTIDYVANTRPLLADPYSAK